MNLHHHGLGCLHPSVTKDDCSRRSRERTWEYGQLAKMRSNHVPIPCTKYTDFVRHGSFHRNWNALYNRTARKFPSQLKCTVQPHTHWKLVHWIYFTHGKGAPTKTQQFWTWIPNSFLSPFVLTASRTMGDFPSAQLLAKFKLKGYTHYACGFMWRYSRNVVTLHYK